MMRVMMVRRRLRKTFLKAKSKNLAMAGSFIRDVGIQGVGGKGVGGKGVGDDLAVAEADNAVSVFEEASIVRGEDEGEAEAAVEVVHEVDELGGVAGVEVGGRLIGEHQGGTMDDGAGDGDTLAFAAGEQVGTLIGAGGEADTFKSGGGALTAFVAVESLDEQGELDVLGGGEYGDEIEGLKDETDLPAAQGGEALWIQLGGVYAIDEDAAGGGLVDAADEVEEGGLAASTGTGDGEELAGGDVEVHVVEGADKAVVHGESAGDCFGGYELRRLVGCIHGVGRSLSGVFASIRKVAGFEAKVRGVSDEGHGNRMRGGNGGMSWKRQLAREQGIEGQRGAGMAGGRRHQELHKDKDKDKSRSRSLDCDRRGDLRPG
jgi:hypothetical protein